MVQQKMFNVLKKTVRFLLVLLLLFVCLPAFAEEGMVTLAFGAGSVTVPADSEYVDLGDLAVPYSDGDYARLDAFIESLPNLKKLDMFATDIRKAQIEHLAEKFPEIEFGWTMAIPCVNNSNPGRNMHRIRTDATAFSTYHNSYCTLHTNEDISILKYCKNLQALDLGHNHITDLTFLYDHPDLRVLILGRNDYITDITPIGSLVNLEYLEIFSNKITDISPLLNCTKLLDLSLCNNLIEDLSPLLEMKSLRRLWLWKYNRNAPSAIVPKDVETQLREALPDCLINVGSDPSQGGWRNEGTRYDTIKQMFKYRDSEYIPFDNYD